MTDLVLRIKVIPRSPKTEIIGTMDDGTLKVRVAAQPEKGKANAELIAFLAKYHGVPRANVTIISGASSHLKQVRIHPNRDG